MIIVGPRPNLHGLMDRAKPVGWALAQQSAWHHHEGKFIVLKPGPLIYELLQ